MAVRFTADDKIDIQEVIIRFFMAVDEDDAAGVAGCFGPEGVLVLRHGDEHSAFSELVGTSAIEEGSRAFLAKLAETAPNKDRHVISNFLISPGDDGAEVRFLVQNIDVAVGPTLLGTAVGKCHVVRVDGIWRLQRWDHFLDPAREHSGK
jgi:hypothetical protein